eukprot:CAMPEP_0167790718 /NCGR_PEP_ID=MMETSP0111_2-20121227/11502_1 /TAXON_ID=91324 /ORGANISM="Lotharella globosa, Strain CCCM811" /LENGTH=147 /DNA_ID=CAMNT_0007683239 /DNA_START=191 /DNA_END=634 /DNA_ORIENTATION=+
MFHSMMDELPERKTSCYVKAMSALQNEENTPPPLGKQRSFRDVIRERKSDTGWSFTDKLNNNGREFLRDDLRSPPSPFLQIAQNSVSPKAEESKWEMVTGRRRKDSKRKPFGLKSSGLKLSNAFQNLKDHRRRRSFLKKSAHIGSRS